jgi:hypothetical protein
MKLKDRFGHLEPSEEAKRLLTPDDLKVLEQAYRELNEEELEELSSPHPEKFDAKDLQPLDGPNAARRRRRASEAED